MNLTGCFYGVYYLSLYLSLKNWHKESKYLFLYALNILYIPEPLPEPEAQVDVYVMFSASVLKLTLF